MMLRNISAAEEGDDGAEPVILRLTARSTWKRLGPTCACPSKHDTDVQLRQFLDVCLALMCWLGLDAYL